MPEGGIPTILIVEDEAPMRRALNDKFAREGFIVLLAKNGAECVSAALREHPDMILLDIMMPVMDGATALQEIRKDAWGKNAKVMLLTNLSDADKMSQVVEDGVEGYLLKSDWKIEDVVKKVKEKLNIKE